MPAVVVAEPVAGFGIDERESLVVGVGDAADDREAQERPEVGDRDSE
jgi:hypothetical protein